MLILRTIPLVTMTMVVFIHACGSTEEDGPADWARQALASEGACTVDSECVVYESSCLPLEVREHSSCAISVPTSFDTTELDLVMQEILESGLSPWEGGCGMCTLLVPPDPVCVDSECTFPP